MDGDRKLRFDKRNAALTSLTPEPWASIRPVLASAEPTIAGLLKN